MSPQAPVPATGMILAAGRSRRMGAFKPLLPLPAAGGQSLLEHAALALRRGGVQDVCVVTGHRRAELAGTILRLGLREAAADPDAEMLDSLRAGVRALPEPARAALILPVDAALVRPATVATLLDAAATRPERALVPVLDGRRGHPPLLPRALLDELLVWTGSGGLRAFLGRHPPVEVPVADESIFLDMDTPEDALRAEEAWCRRGTPTNAEAEALLALAGVPADTLAHCRAVSRVAETLGVALQAAGQPVDPELARNAALLHDVAKGGPDHAAAGARLLRHWNFYAAAAVVEHHPDLPADGLSQNVDEHPVDAAEVVYLADKLVQGDCLVRLEERFAAKLARHKGAPGAARAVAERLERALRSKRRLETALGHPLDDLLRATA